MLSYNNTMSRQRDHDIDEDFQISIGLSDIEKEDEEIMDKLADTFKKTVICKKKINLKKPRRYNKVKCRIHSSPLSLCSLFSTQSTLHSK